MCMQVDPVMTVVSNKDNDSGPNTPPCQDSFLLVAVNHQQMHNRTLCQWYAGTVPGYPYDYGLEERNRIS